MVVTRSVHKQLFHQEAQRLSPLDISLEFSPLVELSHIHIVYPALFFVLMKQQLMNLSIEEQIRALEKFGGSFHEDVIQWLHDVDEVFDRFQLQSSNKYIAVQFYFTGTLLKWFRYNKWSILDRSTFQREIIQAFQPSFHQPTVKKDLQTIKKEQDILPISVSTLPYVSSTSTILLKEKDDANKQLDLSNDNRIELFEDSENQCLRESEPGRSCPMSANIDDLSLEIPTRCTDETNGCDQSKQQHEYDSVKPDVEDTFEALVGNMGSLTADNTLITTVVPRDVQYLWSNKYRSRQSRVFNQPYTGYDWFLYNKQHYDTDHPLPKIIQCYKCTVFYPKILNKA